MAALTAQSHFSAIALEDYGFKAATQRPSPSFTLSIKNIAFCSIKGED